jgi:hypothetical protein
MIEIAAPTGRRTSMDRPDGRRDGSDVHVERVRRSRLLRCTSHVTRTTATTRPSTYTSALQRFVLRQTMSDVVVRDRNQENSVRIRRCRRCRGERVAGWIGPWPLPTGYPIGTRSGEALGTEREHRLCTAGWIGAAAHDTDAIRLCVADAVVTPGATVPHRTPRPFRSRQSDSLVRTPSPCGPRRSGAPYGHYQ